MSEHRHDRNLLVEHQVVEDLASKLAAACGVSSAARPEEWIRDVTRHFSAFRTHFVQHMALEEREGVFAGFLKQAPGFKSEIDRLIGEHRDFAMILELIRETLEALRPEDRLLIRDCKHRIRDLLAYLEHHERDENMIARAAIKGDNSAS